MTTRELIKLIAERADMPPERAADELSLVVSGIRERLRKGSSVKLPGLGVLEPHGRGMRLKPVPSPAAPKRGRR